VNQNNRKLKPGWSVEMAQDLRAFYGINFSRTELLLSSEMAKMFKRVGLKLSEEE
jgi:hypothetical protein